MALPQWPAELPQIPRVSSGSTAPYQAPLETEMEDGPPRARRTATATWSALTVEYVMEAWQFATFEWFVRDHLSHGTGRFLMPMWRPGATQPLPLKTARITGGVPSWRPVGTKVFVTLPISVLDY